MTEDHGDDDDCIEDELEGSDESAKGHETEDEVTEEAYVTYQNAKAKYKAIVNARGITMKAKTDERIKAAKARSYCSACKKRGHWHRDPECPLNKGKNNAGDRKEPHQAQYCHVAYMAGIYKTDTLYGITDCACTRTVAGRDWVKKMIKYAEQYGVPHFIMKQDEVFKFGGPDTFPSRRALVVWLEINQRPFALRISEVECPLPLSRGALAMLGMRYDLEGHKADFGNLGVAGLELGMTETGHPTVPVTGRRTIWPDWPFRTDWSTVELYIESKTHGCYMVRPLRDPDVGQGQVLYPKKIPHNQQRQKLIGPVVLGMVEDLPLHERLLDRGP